MAAPIPTHGYRSRTAAVVAMLEQGQSFEHIARKLGITVKKAMDLDTSHRRQQTRRLERARETVRELGP